MSHEPIKPLFEDASAPSELRNFVALARNDGASQAELDRLAMRMAPVLGVSAAFIASSAAAIGSTAPLSTGAALGTSGLATSAFGAPASGLTPALGAASAAKVGAASAAKVGLFSQLMASATAKVLAVSLSVGAAGAAVYGATRPERPASAPQAAVESGHSQAGVGAVAQPAPSGAASASTDALAPAGEPQVAQLAVPSAAPAAPAERAPRKFVAARHLASASATEAAMPAADPIRDEPVAAQAVPEAEHVKAVPPPSELSLIERAEAARTHPNEALAFLAKHEEVYPRGALAQEREVLAIELLLKAGKLSQAETRAERFEDTYPQSAHLPRVRALLTRSRAK